MNRRFEIEEILAQDEHRVVFRAHDRESGDTVVVRRLVPGGHEHNGLDDAAAGRFDGAVRALASIESDSLRDVVTWGLDPHDRVPFVVTEWIEGESLAQALKRGVLSDGAGRVLVEHGLAVQMALDATGLGWQIDTSAESVMIEGNEERFRFSFWVHPFPDGRSSTGSVDGLASLVELAMGWKAQLPAASAGGGLAGWVRLMHHGKVAAVDALRELRGMKTRPEEAVPQPQAAAQARPRPVTKVTTRARSSRTVLRLIIAASVVIVGIGAWLIFGRNGEDASRQTRVEAGSTEGPTRQGGPKSRKAAAPLSAEQKLVAAANARAAELARELAAASSTDLEADESKPHNESDGTFGPDEGEAMRSWINRGVTLEGALRVVRDSNTGKTRYLEFSGDRGVDNVCGRFLAADDGSFGKGLSAEGLKALEGKRLALHGEARIEKGTGRIVVHLDSRDQIEELK